MPKNKIFKALFLLTLFISPTIFAADRYVRAAGGNFSAAGTWESAPGLGDAVAVPTAADNVYLVAGSGQLTIDVASVCRSINATGYTNTLTHAAAVTLTIGDSTPGTGYIALKFVAGMTYNLGNIATSAISFVSSIK